MTYQAQPSPLFPQQVLGTTILINEICLFCLLDEFEVVLRYLAVDTRSSICVVGRERGCVGGPGFPLKYLRHKVTVPALPMCQAML
jgi:hypothetical protein